MLAPREGVVEMDTWSRLMWEQLAGPDTLLCEQSGVDSDMCGCLECRRTRRLSERVERAMMADGGVA